MSKVTDFEYSVLSTLSETDLPAHIAEDLSNGISYTVPEIAKFLLNDEVKTLSKQKEGSVDHKCTSNRIEIYNYVISNSDKYGEWKFINMTDQNKTNGLVAYTVDVGNGEGVFTSRSTENFISLTKDQTDNLDSIKMLLSEDGSPQQEAMLNYVMEMLNKHDSMNFSLTATSKGGNNVVYAMVEIAKRPKFADRLTRCVATNSPGFSDAYVKANQEYIDAVKGKITLYQNEGDPVSDIGKSIGNVRIIKSAIGAFLFSGMNHEAYAMFNLNNNNGYISFNKDADGRYLAPDFNDAAKNKTIASRVISSLPNYGIGVVNAYFVLSNLFPPLKKTVEGVVLIAVTAVSLVKFTIAHWDDITAFAKSVKDGAVKAAVALYAWAENLASMGAEIIKNAVQKAADMYQNAKKAIVNFGNDLLKAAGNFFNNVGNAVKGFFGGAADWLKGLFGSASSALAAASMIVVTISQIDDMQRKLITLRTRYLDAKTATSNTCSIVSKVSSHYHESYVRSCCRDIENDIKNVQKFIDTAERSLDNRRRALATAVDSYYKADQNAKRDLRAAASFA